MVAAVPYYFFTFISKPDKSLLIRAILQNCSEMQTEGLPGRLLHHEAGPQVYPVLTPVSF